MNLPRRPDLSARKQMLREFLQQHSTEGESHEAKVNQAIGHNILLGRCIFKQPETIQLTKEGEEYLEAETGA